MKRIYLSDPEKCSVGPADGLENPTPTELLVGFRLCHWGSKFGSPGEAKARMVPTLYPVDLKKWGFDEGCGFSVYRDILVFWDDDHDGRVFDAIDQMSDEERNLLLVIKERKGSVMLLWNGEAPGRHEKTSRSGFDVAEDENRCDSWGAADSFVLEEDGSVRQLPF